MNKQVTAAAMELASVMVSYEEMRTHCEQSELQEDKAALRRAYDAMLDAQNNLYFVVKATTKPL